MNYFWTLDNEVSQATLKDYKEAVAGDDTSSLANLVRMVDKRIPISPKAYVTSAAMEFSSKKPDKVFFEELAAVIEHFEKVTHSRLGAQGSCMLLCVQGDFSGAVRNIGACQKSLPGLIHSYGPVKAFTLYVDFLESYATQVMGCPYMDFRKTFGIEANREGGAGGLAKLSVDQFLRHVAEYQQMASQKTGKKFPENPEQHLLHSLIYCFSAAKEMGRDEIFIKTQVHASQYGQSTHGVVYTRNPFNGKQELYGVYENGTDGKKYPIEDDKNSNSLKDKFPSIHALLKKIVPTVEAAYRDVMEVEFVTDEDGRLFLTGFDKAQTTAKATIVAALELSSGGMISDLEAALRIRPYDVEVLLHPTLDDESRAQLKDLGSTGVTAAPGTSIGKVFFKMKEAMEYYSSCTSELQKGFKPRIILITDELLISDTPGLGMISGLITKASGIASHAAVMARANGIPCVVGYKGLEVDLEKNCMFVNGTQYKVGTEMTLEAGSEGRLYLGQGKLQNLSHQDGIVKDVCQLVARVLKKENIPLEIRVNINNAKDAQTGLNFGADGVGLCRTENMFMSPEALKEIRNIVFTRDAKKTRDSFSKLEEIQYEDFRKIFRVMEGRVVNIRLMDLPLHDLAPHTEEEYRSLEKDLSHMKPDQIRLAGESLAEHNPMLGLRACRFGIIMPELYDMQIRAIVRAAYNLIESGVKVDPGIMFPLVGCREELQLLKERVVQIEESVRVEMRVASGQRVKIRVGSMIELPAAALSADHLATVGEFFAFGTNDLTQTTLGVSRDDSAHYFPTYLEKKIFSEDPFKVLAAPVRELIDIAVRRGLRVRHDASYGICGEQGADRTTLQFCLEKGLQYISGSAYRVLPAKVALVHVALAENGWKSQQRAMMGSPSNGAGTHVNGRAATKAPTQKAA